MEYIATSVIVRILTTLVSKKDIGPVVVPTILTHDLYIETIRACIHVFGTLSKSISFVSGCSLTASR